MNSQAKKLPSRSTLLIALCWLVYTTSYVAKLSYNANISLIGDAFDVSYAEAGAVSTFFFFAYGTGQVINGLLCKKYNIRLTIFLCLFGGAVLNVILPFLPSFEIIKYVWLLNGVLMSFLWTSIIRLLSETLPNKELKRAIVIMATTVATGTFLVYGISSLCAAVSSFRTVFIIAACLAASVAVLWLIFFNKLVIPLKREYRESAAREIEKSKAGILKSGLLPFVSILALFCVANNFVKDGLTAWTPDILKSLYSTADWLSILITLLLPMASITGALVAVKLQSVTKSYVGSCTVLFTLSGILTGVVILLLSTSLLPITIGCFAMVSCMMAGVNDILTSMVPLSMRERLNSGRLAGILNGFCYLGSTVSSYTLGAIADGFGWRAVFITLLAVMLAVVIVGFIYFSVMNAIKKGKGSTTY